MTKKADSAAAVAEAPKPESGNISFAQLGTMIGKRRTEKVAAAASKPAKEGEQAEPAESEQPEGEAEEADLSNKPEGTLATEAEAEEAEEGAEGSEQADATEEAEGEEEAPKPPKGVEKLQKRVHELVDQRDAERQARLEAERKLAELQAAPANEPKGERPSSHEQFGNHPEITKIDKRLGEVEAFLAWAEENPNGGSFEDGGKTYELSGDEIRTYRRQCDRDRISLNSTKAAKMEALQTQFHSQRAAAHDEAVKLYPWIEKKATREFQEAVRIIRENPGVLQRADFELVVARQVVGEMMEREAKKKATNGTKLTPLTAGAKPTQVVTHSPTAQPRLKAKPGGEAEAKFKESGSVKDLSKLLAERKRLKEAA